MNLWYKSEFTVEIGQYFVGRRSWHCVIWHHSCSYFYIKRHTLQKYLIATSNWRCSCIFFYCWWVLSDQGNLSTAWYVFAPTGQRGKWYEKIFFAFDFHSLLWQRHIGARIIPCHCISITRPTLERRKTLGHLRSINRNMIIHFANQSQTCQIFKVVNNIFSNFSWKETVKSGGINLRLNWYIESISIIKSVIYIYIHIYRVLGITFNDLSEVCKSEFTGWAIIEEQSICRRLGIFLISWGQKTHVKHCNVDLSSRHELWFAIICIDMDVILDLSTAILQI